jgi:hypothetical protein
MARQLRGVDPKNTEPSKPKILIFGRPGVGKTWCSLEWPSVYYIDTEGGANLDHYTDKLKKAGGAYLGPKDGANDFNVVIEEVVTLATTEHPYRTLVIDSFSKLFNTQVDINYEAMQKAGREMDKTFGAEKKTAISMTRRLVRWFEKLDMNCILICHEKDSWKDGKQVGYTFDGWDKLEYELHLALHITKIGKTRTARVSKSRLTPFPDEDRFDWNYETFAERYGRSVIESAAKATKMATPEQIKKLEGLISALNVTPENVAKLLEKASAETFDEVPTETADKWIGELSKRVVGLVGAAA